ncbi:hypothetical protein ACP6L2_01245 [Sphingobacterium lactis]|uniref:hypothetical protein n=1 Tax=Sphingobacterium lactis TaxID=797291 RepID=UPI003F7D8801
MIRKRAHILKYQEVVSSEGHYDEFDNWIPGDSVKRDVELICRADPNSSGRTIPNNQGQDFVYSFSIFLNNIPESLKPGVEIKIFEKGKMKALGPAIMSWDYQTTKRLWV